MCKERVSGFLPGIAAINKLILYYGGRQKITSYINVMVTNQIVEFNVQDAFFLFCCNLPLLIIHLMPLSQIVSLFGGSRDMGSLVLSGQFVVMIFVLPKIYVSIIDYTKRSMLGNVYNRKYRTNSELPIEVIEKTCLHLPSKDRQFLSFAKERNL